MEESIIQLEDSETIPEITHYRICAWKLEVSRESNPGYIEIWLARCYYQGTYYYEDPRLTGGDLYIRIEGTEYKALMEEMINSHNLLKASMDVINNFLINMGYIHGTVVDIDIPR